MVQCWMCRICYNDKVNHPLKAFIKQSASTNSAQRHMAKHGYNQHGERQTVGVKRKNEDIRRQFEDQERANNQVFNVQRWQDAYVCWVSCSGISLRQASSKRLYQLLTFQNPRLRSLVPRSHSTVRRMVLEQHEKHKVDVIAALARAKSGMTISFDGWKADNEILDLLGIVAHYLDDNYRPKSVVLGLRDTMGSHTGENIAQQLIDVLRDYQICDKVAFFASDNATNNDKALRVLQQEDLGIDPVKQRLRCAGHILNLVCKAILYGVDDDCVEGVLRDVAANAANFTTTTAFENTLRTADEQARLAAWRKKGPVGRLHNLVVHIKHNNARMKYFESKQREAADSDSVRLYRAVLNGGVRWNSTYDMIKRGMLLKDALQLYQEHYRAEGSLHSSDCLASEDWLQLTELHELLDPIHAASLRMQSEFSEQDHEEQLHEQQRLPDEPRSHGALHEVLPTIDYLLTELETAKERLRLRAASHFKASVNLGWKKLDQYYMLTDNAPAYCLAVFLHPHYKDRWFRLKWSNRKDWLRRVDTVIEEAYAAAKKQYSNEVIRISPKRELSRFAAYNNLDDIDGDMDELTQYRRELPADAHVDPLAWWVTNHHRFPVLRHLAFTLLAAPASTAADERLFSMAGGVVNQHRPHTQQELAESVQCLRSWYTKGLV